ncbi:MAG: sel1 repeat family protein [Gluconacetobacter diazotrophicus]|nr:sel1 repeat family protein [Gluconacetobacter diazotrophicus]
MGAERWLGRVAMVVLLAGAPARAEGDTVDAGIAAFRVGAFAEAARSWYEAADRGDGRAARFIGVMFDAGQGVQRDPAAAMRWYRRAAELGDAPAMLNVAVMLDAGVAGPRDPAAAAQWYRQAADQHMGRAAYDLALMYRSGDGVPRDPRRARALMRQAATDGVAAASNFLPPAPRGVVTSVPDGPARPANMPQDPLLDAQRALLSRSPAQKASAVALFRRAAASGEGDRAAMASYDLAWCYQNGIGVAADRDQAYRNYLRAAAATTDRTTRGLAESGAAAMRDGVRDAPPDSPSPRSEPETPAASPAGSAG